MKKVLYAIEEHKHRYAAWAASRAASTKTCRFEVLTGKEILEEIGLHNLLSDPNNLPSPEHIDIEHRKWRKAAIESAEQKNLVGFGHGVAAKLINVYLKGAFVCGGHENHLHVAALHPPIDSLLLDELYKKNIGSAQLDWKKARKLRWSKFTSEQYESLISAIRTVMLDEPMWKIESYWRGHL